MPRSIKPKDIPIRAIFVPNDDPDASLALCRARLGFVVRNDLGGGRLAAPVTGPDGDVVRPGEDR